MIKYSSDCRVKYDSEKHTYELNGKMLLGVTTFISQFKEKFDAEKIAAAYVKKHGGSAKELIEKWALESKSSAIQGTAIHNIFEHYILTGEIKLTGNYEKEKQAVKFINDFFVSGRLTAVAAEIVVYNEKLGLASQIDCIAKNKFGEYFILDWKTNKKVTMDSWGKKLASPFNYLPDANFYHYSLQIDIYKLLYTDNKIKDGYIVHLDNHSYNFLKIESSKTDLYPLLALGRL